MKSLEHQLAEYGDHQRELHGPISVAELDTATAIQAAPGHGRRARVWVTVVVAAAVVLLLGAVPLLLQADQDVSPADTSSSDIPLVVSAESFNWTLVEAADAPHDMKLRWTPDVLYAGGRYFVSLMPDILREADEPMLPNELWASDDGLIWELDRMPVEELVAAGAADLEAKDTAAFQLADLIVVDPYGRWDPVVRSDDGVTWTVADIELDTAGGVIWKVDNAKAMFEVAIPWRVGGFGPTGWVFEFAGGYTGLQVTPPFGDRQVAQPFEAYHTPNGQDWSRIDAPAFVAAGYDHFEWRVGFAHQNGVALVVLADADHRDPLNTPEFRMWRSNDGITWEDITPRPLAGAGVWALEGIWIQGPSALPGDGSPLSFLVSRNGQRWEQLDMPSEFADFEGEVRVAGNKIFVFGEDHMLVGTYTP